jgi:hypothetical protein
MRIAAHSRDMGFAQAPTAVWLIPSTTCAYRACRWRLATLPALAMAAYASRRRWIRTPNDGFLTVNFHFGKAADKALNLLLASSYSGAFHPTAEGQAVITDALADKARGVLDRYPWCEMTLSRRR